MKKSLVVLTILLLVFPVISAVEFDMKTEFNQGETLMAKVSGNFLDPILNNNIFFYRGHVRISMDSYVAKINNTFYIYAPLIGKTQNNYSIVLKNARYYIEGGQISDEDITKNFSITKNISDFSIAPGFVVTKDNFFIEVQNLQDSEITIQIKTNSETSQGFFASLFGNQGGENSISLKAGEIKKINFELNNITQPALKTIELTTENLKYEIPVYIYTEETEQEKKQKSFKFEPSELNISIPTNSNTTKIIYLYNTGEEKLENISLSVSDSLKEYVSFSIEKIEELDKNSSIKIELYFSSDDEEKIIEGQIKAQSQELYSYLAVSLNFLKDYIPLDGEDEIKTCSEMNGTICKDDEKCDEETIYAKDGVCCLGDCKKIKKSPIGKIIGWIIVIAVIGFLIWFFKEKYRGVKKEIDLFKIGKGKKK